MITELKNILHLCKAKQSQNNLILEMALTSTTVFAI